MTNDELLAEVKRHWEHWAGHLGLENWWVHFEMVKKTERHFLFEMHPQWDGYQRVSVRIAPVDQERWFERNLSRNVLHEVVHLVFIFQDNLVENLIAKAKFGEYMRCAEANVDELAAIIWRLHEQTGCED